MTAKTHHGERHARGRHAPSAVATLPESVVENIEHVAALYAKYEGELGVHQRAIERVTVTLGRPRSVYVLVGLIAVWVLWNAGMTDTFDRAWALDPPPYHWLQGFLSLAALVMAVMILTTQNRQAKHSAQRAHLDLQVNLLAEQKMAKLISLVEELRRDLPSVKNRKDAEAEAMSKPLDAHAVATALAATQEEPKHPPPATDSVDSDPG